MAEAGASPKSDPHGDHNPVSIGLLGKKLTTYNIGGGLTDENFVKAMKKLDSDIIFVQEFTVEKLQKMEDTHNINYVKNKYEGAILVKANKITTEKSVNTPKLISQSELEELQITLEKKISERQCTVLIPDLDLIAISWHGRNFPSPNKVTEEKTNDFINLQKYALELKIKKGCSVIIGGDFNIDIADSKEYVFKKICPAVPDIKETRRKRNIDYFLIAIQLNPVSVNTSTLYSTTDAENETKENKPHTSQQSQAGHHAGHYTADKSESKSKDDEGVKKKRSFRSKFNILRK